MNGYLECCRLIHPEINAGSICASNSESINVLSVKLRQKVEVNLHIFFLFVYRMKQVNKAVHLLFERVECFFRRPEKHGIDPSILQLSFLVVFD